MSDVYIVVAKSDLQKNKKHWPLVSCWPTLALARQEDLYTGYIRLWPRRDWPEQERYEHELKRTDTGGRKPALIIQVAAAQSG